MKGYHITQATRLSLRQAQDLAHSWHHSAVDCRHLLSALLRDPTPAIKSGLATLGHDASDLVRDLHARIGPGPPVAAEGLLPFGNEAKTALEIAKREAEYLGHIIAAPEHLLVGISGVPDCEASHFLHEHGLTPDRLEPALTAAMVKADATE